MNAKKWMLVAGIASLGIAAWWLAQRDVAEPMLVSTTPKPIIQPAPVVEVPSASSSVVLPVVQPSKISIAPSIPKNIDDFVDWQHELVAALIVTNDPDSIMAAALILHALDAADRKARRTIRTLLDQAYSLASGDRAIASVALRVCRSMNDCNPARYDVAIRNIDARNALGPLPELLNRIEKGPANQVTESLDALGKLRLNLYNGELLARVARAISSAPTSPRFAPETGDLLRLQSELALRAVEAVEVPSYLSIGAACQKPNWQNFSSCDAVVRDLSRGELIELQRLGMEIDAARVDNRTKRPTEIAEAELYLNWVGSMKARNPPAPEQWIALLAQHRSELAASRAWIDRNGVTPKRVPRWLDRSY